MNVSNLFIFVLIVVSLRVACGLMAKRNMWKWIVFYWCVLALKNAADFWNSIV